jgi:hypothetical protein
MKLGSAAMAMAGPLQELELLVDFRVFTSAGEKAEI